MVGHEMVTIKVHMRKRGNKMILCEFTFSEKPDKFWYKLTSLLEMKAKEYGWCDGYKVLLVSSNLSASTVQLRVVGDYVSNPLSQGIAA